MADKRLIYFTATRVVLYRWGHGRLTAEASFANSEDGAAAFAAQLRAGPGTLFYVLVDIVEEDFHQENVPFVRGGDRRTLLARKLAQRYRDTSLALALSLGYEKTQRRDERILFSSFTNNAQFQPWLQALHDKELAVAGVYSVALLAPRLAAKIGPKKAPVLLVSLQHAGLRQSFVDGGRIRFSRLGPMDAADAADPERVAEAFDRETTRVYQYLTAMRVVARDGGAIDAVLVAPRGEKRRVQAAAPNLPQVRIGVIDLAEAAGAIGLKAFPEGSGAEALYLHLLAQHAPAEQYAGEGLRQFFRLHQLRAGLIAGGAALGALGLVFAGIQLVQAYNLGEQTALDRERARVENDQSGRVTSAFPRLPTTTDNLRATMEKYGALTKQASPPERLLAEVSRALEASPRIEVDKVHWELATKDPKEIARDADPARARAATAPAPGAAAPAQGLFEVADVTAKVLAVKASDYRAVTQAINEFMDALRKRPGVEVVATKMPVETGSGGRLSGEVGAEALDAKVPQFTLTIARRIPQ